jgi:EpsI family protein
MPYSVAIIIYVAGLFFANSLSNTRQMHLVGELGSLANLANYTAVKSQSPDLYADPTADATLSIAATDRVNKTSEIFVGYRAEQTGGLRLRSPKLIFPENWNSVWVKPADVEIGGKALIRGNWMLTRKGDSLRLVLYWYQFEESAFSGEFEYRLRQLKRALIDRRSDGAVVRLATAVRADEPIEPAQQRLRALAVDLYPRLVALLPQ